MTDQQCKNSISYVEQYLSQLRDYLVDDNINEVAINPNGSIFIEEADTVYMREIGVTLPPQAIKRLGAQLAGETRHTLGALNPVVSGRVMVWGNPQRVQVVVEPAIEQGVSLSIRKYLLRTSESADIDYVDGRQIMVDAVRHERHRAIADAAKAGDLKSLFRQAVDEKFNVLISGGTSSGKTTVARALLAMANPAERIITIEDAQELHPPHKNQVGLIADRKGESARSPSNFWRAVCECVPTGSFSVKSAALRLMTFLRR
ncbi:MULTISPECIES: ATPase, T2SS/T4P/T4SS family [unclassified Mesorhizobium]|uniref:ATPase, T2SS/T4P/T4SS family n=2 Tax=Mesorhizobium TaxID=68287 RepID=UPI0025DDDE31|nr:ATPase, T2SS/T4P/T4SS family [Mesorhizobium sp.]